VCTLWDVTDKDIDRFSRTVFVEWGLFEEKGKSAASGSNSSGAMKKAKGKVGKSVQIQQEKENLSLAAAVAKGRSSCHLKYLNGAATVVYGIPVYLA